MNYTTTQVCTAHISVNKNRVKIYQKGILSDNRLDIMRAVFLKDGQNFEIELYNPKQNSVLAKITLNGKDISSSGIVLRPGQRVYIERFIDTPRKFEFSTYEVGDTVQNRTAIAKNGEVEVKFYDEYVPCSSTWTTNPCYIHSTGTSTNTNFSLTSGTSTAFYSNGTTNTGTLNVHVAGSLETGRVEQGKSSGQSFSITNGTFNSYACSTETIKLFPASQKPVESAEIRNYCTSCGTRAKKTGWKFCPSCGSKF